MTDKDSKRERDRIREKRQKKVPMTYDKTKRVGEKGDGEEKT